jgi:soluble cytochrome b562
LNQQFNARPEAQAIEQLEGAIAQLAEYVEALTQRVDSTSAPQAVDLTGVEQTITTIQGQLESLNQQFNARPEAPALEQSQAAIAQLSEQLETVTLYLENIPTAQTITTIQDQLESLNQQFNARPEAQAIEQLEGAIAQLAEYVETLAQPVDGTSAPQSVDFTGFEEAILELSVQLDALKQRVDHLSTPQVVQPREEEVASQNILGQQDLIASPFDELPLTTVFDEVPLPVPEKVKPIGQEVASTDIPGPLGELIQRFQDRPETQAIKHIETTVEQLTEQLVAVASRLGQLKTASDVNVSGLKQAIADSQGQMDVLYQHFKARPETQAIEQLEDAIAQFGEIDLNGDEEAVEDFNFQVDAMSLCLENLPAPLPFDLDGVEQAMANLDSELKALNSLKNGAAASSVDPWDDAKAQNLEPLATAIVLLQEELKASISYLENLPDPQGDLWGDEDEIANLQW